MELMEGRIGKVQVVIVAVLLFTFVIGVLFRLQILSVIRNFSVVTQAQSQASVSGVTAYSAQKLPCHEVTI
jgi:hypothetical protein